MATSIHALAFKASFDTKPLKDGMTLTRKEIASAKSITDKYKTSSERLAEQHAKLQRLVSAGAISQDAANREMQEAVALQGKFNREAKKSEQIQNRMGGGAGGGMAGGLLRGGVARLGGLAAGAVGLNAIKNNIGDAVSQMDQLDHLSNKLSLPVEDLQRFAFAAERFGELDLESSANGLAAMNKNVFALSQGNSKAVKTFEAMGLQASQLEGLAINEKFLLIADSLRKIDDEGKRLALVEKVFGSGDFVGLMKTSNQELDAMMKRLDALDGVSSAADVAAVAAAADKWTEAGVTWQGVWRDITTALVNKTGWAADIATAMPGAWKDIADPKSWTTPGYTSDKYRQQAFDRMGGQAQRAGDLAGLSDSQLDELLARQSALSQRAGRPITISDSAELQSMLRLMQEQLAAQREANSIARDQAERAESERVRR